MCPFWLTYCSVYVGPLFVGIFWSGLCDHVDNQFHNLYFAYTRESHMLSHIADGEKASKLAQDMADTADAGEDRAEIQPADSRPVAA